MSFARRPLVACLLTVALFAAQEHRAFAAAPDSKPPAAAKPEEQPATAPGPLAGHSLHGEAFNEGPRQAARLLGETGRVHLGITSAAPQAQEYFDQGVGQLHGFWYFEAERSFRQVAALDPECAMAYWGMAMANTNNAVRAKGFIAEATKRRARASPREQLWIDALAEYYKDDKKKDVDKRRQYVRALEKIVHQHPDELEAKAFLAVAIWQNSSKGLPITSHQAVDALLDQVFAVEPKHPAHHYRIHLWDTEKAERALASAARCGPAAPQIAHMWHMPGHTYSKLRRYADAAWQQDAASRTDYRQMAEFRVLPDQIHNYAHNEEWLIRDLNFLGRFHDAEVRARQLIEYPRHPKLNTLSKSGSAQYGRTRLIQTLEQSEQWPQLIAAAQGVYLEPTDDANEQTKRLRALGLALLNHSDPAQGADVISQLETTLMKKKEEQTAAGAAAEKKVRDEAKGKTDKATQDRIAKARDTARNAHKKAIDDMESALEELRAHQLAAQGKSREAMDRLAKRKNQDKAVLSRLALTAGDKAKAEQWAREAVSAAQDQVLPLANYVYVLHAVGKADAARRQFELSRSIAAAADLDVPPLARLAPIAREFKLPEDWRLAVAPREDLGERPPLESLGPSRWQPWAAPEWTLPDAEGRARSLADYRGRPVVVIFYLGAGCLHCVQQLKAFAPLAAEYRESGIELAAISTDTVEALKGSLVDAGVGKNFPIPLVSDSGLGVFKQYRAFDDFEQRPLHATALIDAAGRVRWIDIGPEPFQDARFLLNESKRLLSFSESASPVTANAGP